MRLFFALEPCATSAIEIADWRDKNLPLAGSPVPPQNFHITLAFIGEQRSSVVEQLIDYVDAALEERQPNISSINIDQVGYWPGPGIYWAGPTDWPDGLNRLAQKLKHAGTHIGGRKDRNTFQPHVTLFRRCKSLPQPSSGPDIAFEFEGLSLFESRTGKHGVSYHSLCDWPL